MKPTNDKFCSFAKGARLAVDVFQYEPAIERAIHHACGDALVCDTMEVARYVCYDKGQEVKAVTLEGTIIHKSGLLRSLVSSLQNDEIEKVALDRLATYRKCRLEEVRLPLLEDNLKNVSIEEMWRWTLMKTRMRPKVVAGYGIEVDFDFIEDDERSEDPANANARYEKEIANITAEIERMAPNMKAMERLDDVETKLEQTEREADKASKESRNARDHFNDVKS